YSGRQIFLSFCWAALILLVAIFALLVAKTFVTTPAVATASLLFIMMAPVFGFLVYKKGLSLVLGSFIFVPLLFFFIWLSTIYPLDLVKLMGVTAVSARNIWISVLLIYIFVASVMPVWLLLQPRDYLNSYLLYVMLICGVIGVFVAAPHFVMPAFTGWEAVKPGGGIAHLFPVLYVTVACGACSGFHALVASGTTSKQLDNERHIKPIAYGGMLVEGVLALVALICVVVLPKEEYLARLATESPVTLFASGLSGFTAKLGLPSAVGMTFAALAISAFMLTTLDTATRLARFTWQEIFLPRANGEQGKVSRLFSNPFVATVISVALSGYMAFSGSANQIWPVFGASNQMLAALTLLVVTLVLVKRKANFWIALIPMFFMTTITIWALIHLVRINFGTNNVLLVATASLLVMALILAGKAVWSLIPKKY
ncbi:MAG: carbon starvation protein A, partial [Kiritimatiellae bacterium]|nr:carbon starvation protein A [Kiritimatiellia bacterium]